LLLVKVFEVSVAPLPLTQLIAMAGGMTHTPSKNDPERAQSCDRYRSEFMSGNFVDVIIAEQASGTKPQKVSKS
jgi:hypothetical protein